VNIVIITSLYPTMDKNRKDTLADHYYALEWVKMGHNVLVFHFESLFFLKGFLKKEEYKIEDIPVCYCRYPRFIPKSSQVFHVVAKKVAQMAYKKIRAKFDFVDLFYCDFCASNWEIINELKRMINSMFLPVFNNCDFRDRDRALQIVSSSRIVAARSEALKKRVLDLKKDANVIITLSGAPLTNKDVVLKKIDETMEPLKLLYVGDLIPLKNVDILIESMEQLVQERPYHLTVVGNGELDEKLKKRTKELGLENSVSFLGRIPREKVLEEMLRADIFVMVSSPESFGIVYVEAMASGCYTIAAKREGIDGVIIDGFNGRLLEPRNVQEMVEAIREYCDLDIEERKRVLKNAYNTAQEYSEENVAKKALIDILQ